jgi:thiol:disulfide interchange protein
MLSGMQTRRNLFLAAAAALVALAISPARATVPDIYPAAPQASADIAAALKQAAATHKRVILDFGGNWCADCHVLDFYFHDAANLPLLEANFILVHINIGRIDANVDIAERYKIPLKRGVPAIAVLSSRGSLLYSQKTGEFEDMRHMQSSAVTDFLTRWKPDAR